MILDGKALSIKLKAQLKQRIDHASIKPGLAVILVGDNPASHVYVNHKVKACSEVGIHSERYHLPAAVKPEDLKKLIDDLNLNPKIHGILVQLPLPVHLNTQAVLDWVDPKKDADAIGTFRMGQLLIGNQQIAPCTPSGIIALLEQNDFPVRGKHVVVIGRSTIVGKPMAQLLEQKNATVTLCHSKTENLKEYTQTADIVIVAVGKKHLLGKEDFSHRSIVVDVGMHRLDDGKLCGDVRTDEIKGFVKAYTPVPGGVGPLTIAYLLQNTYVLSQEQR
ncbi:MAG: bifunctional 5,10-methylenetetrahydrofolate dehydrogenase/5,10-methenyltetrahydrofolate cyclohydrolase [Bdellovibrionales bacterium]|nr:bifunctional 5,10-methylenetetrahydrofolate dehydrogenase/5,10-methenyltetrahydrofolate cyclohydrolase [Bdellovibrionales bacterium]